MSPARTGELPGQSTCRVVGVSTGRCVVSPTCRAVGVSIAEHARRGGIVVHASPALPCPALSCQRSGALCPPDGPSHAESETAALTRVRDPVHRDRVCPLDPDTTTCRPVDMRRIYTSKRCHVARFRSVSTIRPLDMPAHRHADIMSRPHRRSKTRPSVDTSGMKGDRCACRHVERGSVARSAPLHRCCIGCRQAYRPTDC